MDIGSSVNQHLNYAGIDSFRGVMEGCLTEITCDVDVGPVVKKSLDYLGLPASYSNM